MAKIIPDPPKDASEITIEDLVRGIRSHEDYQDWRPPEGFIENKRLIASHAQRKAMAEKRMMEIEVSSQIHRGHVYVFLTSWEFQGLYAPKELFPLNVPLDPVWQHHLCTHGPSLQGEPAVRNMAAKIVRDFEDNAELCEDGEQQFKLWNAKKTNWLMFRSTKDWKGLKVSRRAFARSDTDRIDSRVPRWTMVRDENELQGERAVKAEAREFVAVWDQMPPNRKTMPRFQFSQRTRRNIVRAQSYREFMGFPHHPAAVIGVAMEEFVKGIPPRDEWENVKSTLKPGVDLDEESRG